eukprot:763917-Prorocentrum_minimum.AAC.1
MQVVVCVERVLHLEAPGGQAGGTVWVAYDWLETGEAVRTPPIPSEGAGKWYHARVLPLSAARRAAAEAQQHLLLKVQWRGGASGRKAADDIDAAANANNANKTNDGITTAESPPSSSYHHSASPFAQTADQRQVSEDEVTLGRVVLDLAPLFAGLSELCGWYNVVDVRGRNCGQLKLR